MSKSWYESKTIIGAVAALVCAGTSMLGIDLDEGGVTESIQAIGTVVSFVLTVVGRYKAVESLK